MKKANAVPRAQTKTTNYPKDSHNSFCSRCFKRNKGCPRTGSQNKSKSCSL